MEILDNDLPKQLVQGFDSIPSGYIKIDMSSKGCYGVPPYLFVKNFSFEDLLELSLIKDDSFLPEKLISIINNLIIYPAGYIRSDDGVGNWPEQYIIELLIKIYNNYFSPFLTFYLSSEEDKKLFNEFREKNKLINLENLLSVNIPISSLQLYDVDVSSYSEIVLIENKKTKKTFGFRSWVRYGDVLVINSYLKNKYRDLDLKFKKYEKYSTEELEQISEEERQEYNSYLVNKLKDNLIIIKVVSLMKINDLDVSNYTYNDKIKLYFDTPELQDVRLFKKLNSYYDSIKIGINPEITFLHPITKKEETRRFQFRLFEIIQTILLSESDEYDIRVK